MNLKKLDENIAYSYKRVYNEKSKLTVNCQN